MLKRIVPIMMLALLSVCIFNKAVLFTEAETSIPKIDNLIITTSDLDPAATRLAQWKNSSGIPSKVLDVEWIYSNYGGEDNQSKIRNCIKDYYSNFQIKYVTIFGDADKVPTRYVYVPVPDGSDTFTATDLYYAALNGTWDDNHDGLYADQRYDNVDLVPEVSIGRIPVETIDSAQAVVDKIENYQQQFDVSQDWTRRIVLAAGTGSPNGSIDTLGTGPTVLNDYIEGITNDKEIVKLYEKAGNLSTNSMRQEIDQGALFVNFAGHGDADSALGETGWLFYWVLTGVPIPIWNGFGISDVESTTNGAKLPVVTTSSCSTARFDDRECIGEEFVLDPTGGAIAYFGSTRQSYSSADSSSPYRYMGEIDRRIYENFYAGFTRLGQMWQETVKDYAQAYVQNYQSADRIDALTVMEFMLLGDPTIKVGQGLGAHTYFSIEPVATPPLTDIDASINGLETPSTPSPVGQTFTVEIHLRNATSTNVPTGVVGAEVHFYFGNILSYAVPIWFVDEIGQPGGVLTGQSVLYGINPGFYDASGNVVPSGPYTSAMYFKVEAASTSGPWNGADGLVATISFRIIKQPQTQNGEPTVTLPLTNDFTDLADTNDNSIKHDSVQGTLRIDATPATSPLSITISPASSTLDIGQFQLFTSQVQGGTGPYSYQWFLNGKAVQGATSGGWTFMPTSAGSYAIYVNVTDSVGAQATSNTATVTVYAALSASISPSSVALDVGQSQPFTSVVSGGAIPYSYQWYLNGAPVSGATNTAWTFMFTSAGSYTVYLNVTDAVGAVATSETVSVIVNGPLTVSIAPGSVTMDVGHTQLIISTLSGGTWPFTYQWYMNGVAVSDATSATWNLTPNSSGSYSVYVNVTDSVGFTAKSNIATITVNPAIAVTISPASVVMDVGQSQVFSSTVSGGTSPCTYQWYLSGAQVSSATSATWTFTSVSSGSYTAQLMVTDAVSATATSNTATVTVNGALSVTVSPTSATLDVGQSQLFSSTVSAGTGPYSYQWYLDSSAASGATSATWTYTPSASGSHTVYLKVTDSVSNQATSNTATVTVNSALSVSISPSFVTLNVSQSQLFTPTVSGGTSPYTYQWYLNGAVVSSASGSTWTFTPTSAGSYTVYVKVTDAVGAQTTSNTATSSTVPEFSSYFILSLFMMATLLATFVLLKWKRKVRT